MAENNHASFIPKSPNRPNRKVRTTRRIYLLSYISYIIFFGTLLATLAVFFYSVQISKSLEQANTNLQEQQDRFSETQVNSVRDLEKKIIAATQLLRDMSAPTKIFSDIENLIASNVYMTGYKYSLLPNNQYEVEVTGRADSFNQILYQHDVLNRSEIFRDALISNFDYAVNDANFSQGEEDEEEPIDNATQAALIASLLNTENPVISFTFSVINESSSIAYEPVERSGTDLPDTQLLEVRPGGEAEASADDEAAVTSNDGDT